MDQAWVAKDEILHFVQNDKDELGGRMAGLYNSLLAARCSPLTQHSELNEISMRLRVAACYTLGMRRFLLFLLVCLIIVVFGGCDVPTPPPDLPTPTPGSQNPENPLSRLALTPVQPTPVLPFEALNVPPGHIYFVRDTHLWKVNPDGSGETQLANLAVLCPPAPSPDGSQVAFVSSDGLYVVPSSGGTATKLAGGVMPDGQRLGWTNDGSMVGYITLDPTTPGTLQGWAVPVTGGDPMLLTTLNQATSGIGALYQTGVQWSPDGFWVIVAGVNNPSRLLRWPLATGHDSDVRDIPGGEPDWSPDSRSIVYAETLSGGLEMFELVSSEATPFRNDIQLMGTRLGEYGQGPDPRWSPASTGADTDILAYRSTSTDGEPQVGLKARFGTELSPIPPPCNNPSWSPSGDRLVVETGVLGQGALGPRWEPNGLGIVKLNITGKQTVTPLVKNAQWPTWGK